MSSSAMSPTVARCGARTPRSSANASSSGTISRAALTRRNSGVSVVEVIAITAASAAPMPR